MIQLLLVAVLGLSVPDYGKINPYYVNPNNIVVSNRVQVCKIYPKPDDSFVLFGIAANPGDLVDSANVTSGNVYSYIYTDSVNRKCWALFTVDSTYDFEEMSSAARMDRVVIFRSDGTTYDNAR